MKRYCMNSSYMVDANEQEILFFTPTNPQGIISTALWKYRIGSRELRRCFELQESLYFWKYPAQERDEGLQYIALRYPGAACVIGLGSRGEEIFRVEPGKLTDIRGPVFDTAGNIYLCVDNQWIFCLSPAGELLWKWKSVYAVPGVSAIEKYWVFQDRIYVIACGQLYVISLGGTEEESHTIYEFPYRPIQYKVFGDRILLIGMKYQEVQCFDLKGKELWRFSAKQGDKILRIAACDINRIYLEALRSEDHSEVLYVLNEKGEECWELHEKWSELFITSTQEVILLKDKNISIYSPAGQNILQSSGKKDIIFANVFANRLLMIVEGRGKIAVIEQDKEMKEKPLITELPDIEEVSEVTENEVSQRDEFREAIARQMDMLAGYLQGDTPGSMTKIAGEFKDILAKMPDIKGDTEMTEDDIPWQEEILESVTGNLDLFARYFQGEILDIRITCELFSNMKISVRTGEDTWESAMAKDIPYEEVSEDDRDCYKNCCYGNDCIWIEFCDARPEEEVEAIMNSVCDLVSRKYGVEAKLVFYGRKGREA